MRKNVSKVLAAVLLCMIVLLSGCAHKSTTGTPAPAVAVDVRIAQYNQIVSTTNANLATVVTQLNKAGILNDADTAKIASFQDSVAKGTSGLATILASKVPLFDKAVQVQNLALSLIPPSGYQKFGIKDDQQVQALVLAIDAMESTLQIMYNMAKTVPATAVVGQ